MRTMIVLCLVLLQSAVLRERHSSRICSLPNRRTKALMPLFLRHSIRVLPKVLMKRYLNW